MAPIFISIGSNIAPAMNIRRCMAELRAQFGSLRCSTVYRTPAVGFRGDDFLNLVVGVETHLAPCEVIEQLRILEGHHGRVRTGEKFSSRPLDLDLLLYAKCIDPALRLPHPDILRYAFVLKPLAEIAGEIIHPHVHLSIAHLWHKFEMNPDNREVVLQMKPVAL